MSQEASTTFSKMYSFAQQGGDIDAIDQAMSMLEPYDYTTSSMRAIEYCIDGFIANQSTIIAGAPGVGKTNLLVPLACICAGLVSSPGIKATLRRRVVYVTEDCTQVERILRGMTREGIINASEDEQKYWFTVIPSKRASPRVIKEFVTLVRSNYGVKAPEAQNGYIVEPLIVLDTSSATIDLDCENDNSEASKAIASIKERLEKAALWIVAHTSKVSKKSDIDEMSARGAGAFEGDVNATAYIVNVDETRFMCLGKRRFKENFSEIRFDAKFGSETVDADWGEKQAIPFLFGVPVVADSGEREEMREAARGAASLDHREKLRGKVLSILFEAQKNGDWLSVFAIHKQVHGKKEILIETLAAMESTGTITQRKGMRNSTEYALKQGDN